MKSNDPASPARDVDMQVALRERIKELNFLHHAARLLNMRGEPEDILSAVVELLPSAWCYPELASARVTFGELDVATEEHGASPWSMRSEFGIEPEAGPPCRGAVEICYRQQPTGAAADPFLPEERALLESCAELLKAFFERLSAEGVRQKLLEAEAAERAASSANRNKDEFLSNVAHELRSSLHVMRGWVQILQQGPPEDRAVWERGLTILARNVSLQTKLVDDLLDLSRITTGKLQLDLQWLDLAELVGYAVDATRPAAEAKGLELVSDLEHVGDVCADQQRLQQVIYNVLGNAVKFTPAGGSIGVTLRRAGSHAELTIKDSGPGIEPDLLPHVFERFRQAGGSLGRSGLGLGLAIAHYLVERHHGTIMATSDGPGKGATFRILLPFGARDDGPPRRS